MTFKVKNIDKLSRKEREKLNRKMEILSAAVPLFAEKGYDNTTIDDIAEKAEYGKGTIYNYFDSKEDIYWAIHKQVYQGFIGGMEELDNKHENFSDFIKQLTKEILHFCIQNHHEFTIIAKHRTSLSAETSKQPKFLRDYHENTDAIFIKRINKAIKSKEIKDINPNSFITLYTSMIFPYIYKKMFCGNDKEIDLNQETELITDIIFNGIKK